jgi:hypothetical protein
MEIQIQNGCFVTCASQKLPLIGDPNGEKRSSCPLSLIYGALGPVPHHRRAPATTDGHFLVVGDSQNRSVPSPSFGGRGRRS